MKLYSVNENYKLYQGNMLDLLDVIDKGSIDAILTDPPYELNFMSKKWDNSGIAFKPDTWKKCYEVLKPGGYLLAFGGSRTFHRIACAIEDAGFEIRDTIMWLYGSGFPKSMNIGLALDKKNGVESPVVDSGKSGISSRAYQSEETTTAGEYEIRQAQNEWAGWGTALKPSFEPIIVARKPFKGSLVDNIIKYGVGGINIDECRVETSEDLSNIKPIGTMPTNKVNGVGFTRPWMQDKNAIIEKQEKAIKKLKELGRFPANTILTYDETDFDEVCGGFPNTKSVKSARGGARNDGTTVYNKIPQNIKMNYECGFNDSGSASRYFYCAKASKKDRDEGLEEFENVSGADITGRKEGSAGLVMDGGKQNPFAGKASPNNRNTHPTVKPTNLMQYLVRLVTPNGGTVLDPFNGSGSTGKAVMYENQERNKNYKYIGIELTEEYLPIAKARIEYVINQKQELTPIEEYIKEGDDNV